MEGDPWYPTVEDFLHCPPPGWEWVEVDECCPPPPNIHACDPQCKPQPACPPPEDDPPCKPQSACPPPKDDPPCETESTERIVDGIDMVTGEDVCRVGRCPNCGICGCNCMATKGFCECDGSTPGKCGVNEVVIPNCRLGKNQLLHRFLIASHVMGTYLCCDVGYFQNTSFDKLS